MKQLYNFVRMSSTRKLVNILLVFQITGFAFFLGWGLLYQHYQLTFFLIMGVMLLILTAIGFFLTGAVMFFRRENPYTLTENWFGIRHFSHGLMPRIFGLLIMLLSGAGIIALIIPLMRQILSF